MNRHESHSLFYSRFARPQSASPVTTAEIEQAEAVLGVRMPTAYRSFVGEFGTPSTPNILHSVVDQELRLHVLQDFLPICEVLAATSTYRSGGMPDDLVCFAADAMGNMFCFSEKDLRTEVDDAPVYFFDHDFPEDSSDEMEAHPSFDAFLHEYTERIN